MWILAWPGSFLSGGSLPPAQCEPSATRKCAIQHRGSRVMLAEGRSLRSRGTSERGQGPWRLARASKLRERFGNSSGRCLRKRREPRAAARSGSGGHGRRPCKRSRRGLSRKHRVKSGKVVRFPDGRPWRGRGRERLGGRSGQLPVGEGRLSTESPVREIRTLSSMSGERNRGPGGD